MYSFLLSKLVEQYSVASVLNNVVKRRPRSSQYQFNVAWGWANISSMSPEVEPISVQCRLRSSQYQFNVWAWFLKEYCWVLFCVGFNLRNKDEEDEENEEEIKRIKWMKRMKRRMKMMKRRMKMLTWVFVKLFEQVQSGIQHPAVYIHQGGTN